MPDTELSRYPQLSRRGFLGAGLAAGAAAILAACSSADAAGGGSSATKNVRLGFSQSGLTNSAKSRGPFVDGLKKKGITVEWVGPFPNHAPSIQAVVGKSADFTFGGSSTVALAAILAGSDLRLTTLFSNNIRTSSILALPKSGITTVQDLVGKKVAVNKSGLGEFIAVAALEKYKVSRKDVEFVYLNPGDAGPAFYSGKVDAWSIFGDTVQTAQVKYGAVAIFTDSKELDQQLDFQTFAVRADFAAANGSLVSEVTKAYQAEQAWINAHLDTSIEQNAKVQKLDAATIAKLKSDQKGLVTTLTAPFDAAAVANLQKSADWQTAHKVLPKSIDVSTYALTSFSS